MDRSLSPSTSSFAMRQTSLSDLLAGVHGGDGFASFGLSRLPMLPGTRTYAVDPEDPFGNIPPVEPPRPEYADIAHAPALSLSSAAAAAVVPPPPLSSSGVSSLLENTTPPPPRRSQRLAASARTNNTAAQNLSTPETLTPPESRKRKARAPASAPPRKRAARKKPPPNAKDDSDLTDDRKPAAVEDEKDGDSVSCCICMCEPEKQEVSSINGCDHLFCFDCIGKWAERENTCPLCKSRFTSISRVHKAKKRKGEKQPPNSKRVKQRDQRADVISGPAIEAMLANIAAVGNGTQSRFGRFLVALGSRRPPTLVASSRRTTLILEDDVFSDETDDDELPMINFNSLMRRATHNYRPVPSASMHFDMGFGPLSPQFAAAMPPPPPPQPHQFRTYATNTFEQNAGTPSNPLEIDLDDDDDDSEVEVFDSSTSA